MEDRTHMQDIIGTVLVVDDEYNIRNILKTYLEYHNLTVATAKDGEEALDLLREKNFDVVLSDIMMPNMDGLELAAEIGTIQPDTAIILMTGYASVNTAVEAIKTGVSDYVTKPFQNLDSIYQTITRALDHRRLILERKTLIDNLKRANAELAHHKSLLDKKVREIDSELSRRIERLGILYDISRTINSITDLDRLLREIMEKITSMMVNTAGIFWLAVENRYLERLTTVGLRNDSDIPEKLDITEGEIGETLRMGMVRVFRAPEEISDPVLRKICDGENITGMVLIPLRFETGHLGCIAMMFRDGYVPADDEIDLLKAIADQAAVSIRNAELYSSQQRMFRETIEALATAIDSRDHYTGGHSYMVTKYALAVAERMGFDQKRLDAIRVAGLLHDVGKIGISDTILNKPGKLTDQEMSVIKAHPILGRVILESIDALKPIARLVYHHHERYDGKGYPEGIRGEDIPVESRILQVADIFHALTSDRIYRKAMPLEKAKAIIEEGLGTVSDPEIGRIFLQLIEEGAVEIPSP